MQKKFEEWENKSQNPYDLEEMEEERQQSMTSREKMDEKNRKCRLERLRVQEELKKPIEMPEIQMCEYELIREKNIAEMRKTMIESGLFEDLK